MFDLKFATALGHDPQFLDRSMNIPNLRRLEHDLPLWRNAGLRVQFICYDILSLRRVNYAWGHDVGDILLQTVAGWMVGFPEATLYRIEGDMFALALVGQSEKDAIHYANNIKSRFSHPWPVEREGEPLELFTDISISVVVDSDEFIGRSMADIFERSLEISRQSHQVTLFTAQTDRESQERIHLQDALKSCVLGAMEGFSVNYQPIADAMTGIWQGVEALCRWRRPGAGPVPPSVFIPEAEEAGLIGHIGEWVLNTAIKTVVQLKLHRMRNFFVSVNVSALQIGQPGFAGMVLKACRLNKFPCKKLLLEITESTQFTFNENNRGAVQQLRRAGVMFGLDDFGTGYSSFNNLKHLPVDFLKTEREFINGIEEDNYLQYFYYVMSETAHSNGKRLIAEGVETKKQLRAVVRNGADLVQGYLFGRPLTGGALKANRGRFVRIDPEFDSSSCRTVDFEHWVSSQDAYQITPALFGLQNSCLHTMLENEDDIDAAFNAVLQAVGEHFKVKRAYVFLAEGDYVFSNRYEWCAAGVDSQIHLFQHVDAREDNFYDVLMNQEIVIAGSEKQLPDNMVKRLREGEQPSSVQSMVVIPMKSKGRIVGFVGFDDDHKREWLAEEMLMLHNLCIMVLILLRQQKCEKSYREEQGMSI